MADLRVPAQRLGELARRLSRPERARADAFHRPGDRDRFVTARGLLREVLGAELGLPAGEVPLAGAPGAKPRLESARGLDDLRFNASRSGERAVIAWARGREVGVDVERERDLDLHGVAARTFSPSELRAWRRLDPPRGRRAFFAAWARKEAYAKGRGQGLAMGLERIEPRAGGEPGRHLVSDPDGHGPWWAVVDVDVGAGYAAAVAAEGEDWAPRLQWLEP